MSSCSTLYRQNVETSEFRLDIGRHHSNSGSEKAITDRLDAVSTESVLRRALELEGEALDESHPFSMDQVERIASEIGLDMAYVRQALTELAAGADRRARLDRFILRDPVVAVQMIEALDITTLQNRLNGRLRTHEGLSPTEPVVNGYRWQTAGKGLARLLRKATQGDRVLAGAMGEEVTHRVHSLNELEHLVSLEADTSHLLRPAKAVLAACVLVGAITPFIFTAVAPLGFTQTLLGTWALAATIGAAAVTRVRRRALRLGRSLSRALTAMASADAEPTPEPVLSRILRLAGSAIEVFGHAPKKWSLHQTKTNPASGAGPRAKLGARPKPPTRP